MFGRTRSRLSAVFFEKKSSRNHSKQTLLRELEWVHSGNNIEHIIGNDPSAGSPTETLLRLLLPLNDQV